ncbi:hypothetical protein [Nesterenkonia ebinurensis]|uniref:hypothetical protein n=1 Tax=Nesterenkonia ebinurensis TaxID=2608252 RepID=UPI00123D720E|nr:hypothetical protein [Nesterenkonia ebinurensis]
MRLSHLPQLLTTGEIRVQLDRERLAESDPLITTEVTSVGDAARRISPPWFFNGTEFSSYGDPGATCHTMAHVVENELYPLKRNEIPDYLMALLAYRLPEGALLLDGNHRFHALTDLAPESPVVIITIEGPLDPAVLPDLGRWS